MHAPHFIPFELYRNAGLEIVPVLLLARGLQSTSLKAVSLGKAIYSTLEG